MKTLLIAVAVVMFLPKAYAQSCSVTITPPSFTLQTGQAQIFTVNETNCSGTPRWTFSSCSPVNTCGTLSSTNTATTTFTAPGASGSATTPEVVQLKAAYVGGSATASVTVTAVQINSLLITSPPPTGSVAAWQTYVLGTSYPSTLVTGINPLMDWSSIETSQGNYTGFDSFDSTVAAYFPNSIPTKKINIIVEGVTGGSAIGGGAANVSTPAYVLTNLGSANIFNNCGYGQATSPQGLPGGFPAVWLQAYFQPYQNFITAVLTHYSSPANSILANYIGYIRFGLSAGGEVYPFCEGDGSPAANDKTWWDYADAMDVYEKGLGSSTQLMTSINQNDSEMGNYTLPDTEASDAASNSIGFGSQGLQQNDYKSGQTCTSDWCNNFANFDTVPLELQTVLLSDPIPNDPITKGTPSQTGSLSQLIPFAISKKAEIFEIYPFDLLYAFDASYCTLSGSTQAYCTTMNYKGNRSYPSCYQDTIENSANGVLPPDPTNCVLNQ